jgi:hypothetical protein
VNAEGRYLERESTLKKAHTLLSNKNKVVTTDGDSKDSKYFQKWLNTEAESRGTLL